MCHDHAESVINIILIGMSVYFDTCIDNCPTIACKSYRQKLSSNFLKIVFGLKGIKILKPSHKNML